MDTKWKNRKSVISFMIFFLGVSLTMGSITGIIRDKPGRVKLWQPGKILQNDYQERGRFHEYVSNQLGNFLVMAAGGVPGSLWEYDIYTYYDYGIGYEDSFYYDNGEYDGGYYDEEGYCVEGGYDYSDYDSARYYGDYWNSGEKSLTEEEKKKIAERYHDRIKSDKNLLYTVSYDGKVLYSNSDALTADGSMTALEGKASDGTPLKDYNFFLYFDGEKVRIVKDGKELDVYGDGYYREKDNWHEGNNWYVPGYRNFPVDEKIEKARVCIAIAREPVFYTEAAYGNIGSRQPDNALYWMYYQCQLNREILLREAVCLGAGAILLFLAFLGRKSRRKAVEEIAGFQAKIWIECKVLLILGMLGLAVVVVVKSNYEYGIWQELTQVYLYEYGADMLLTLSGEAVKNIHPLFWVILFWIIYFIWNDLRHNKKIWEQGLIAKLYRTYSAKALGQPLSRKIARRNTAVFVAAVIYGLFAVILLVFGMTEYESVGGTMFLFILATICFLVLVYLASRKNMETARDTEVLAVRVSEIHSGNYGDSSGQFSGHDMEEVMTQLEDIRHGMAKAVDEQMKSERMKVELIANVSHDIKTPLTSIISYVQFLKQEEGLPDHVKDYVMILDEKSQRLKNMVQDVFAVSKAASGELPMHMEELDFGKLLRQTLADMEEQIGNSAVTFRTEIPREPVMITADGQRMYRVFQNLFQNAIKYSLDGSRVYVALKAENGVATASVKNTSHMELDKNKDFTERFARGDQSRTDGGSGLGLSIAQSFTEACGGEFSWETDADLFVVRVAFKMISAEMS